MSYFGYYDEFPDTSTQNEATHLPGEVFQACPTWERAHWRDYVSLLAWEDLEIPPQAEASSESEVWVSLLRLLPPRPQPWI